MAEPDHTRANLALLDELRASAQQMKMVAQEAGTIVQMIERVLIHDLGLTIAAEVEVQRGVDGPTVFLGVGRIPDKTYQVVIRTVPPRRPDGTAEPATITAWKEASLEWQLKSLPRLPELLEQLLAVARESVQQVQTYRPVLAELRKLLAPSGVQMSGTFSAPAPSHR